MKNCIKIMKERIQNWCLLAQKGEVSSSIYLSKYAAPKRGSPFLIAICVKTATANMQSRWKSTPCLKHCFMHDQFLKRLLHVSCLILALFLAKIISEGPSSGKSITVGSPLYPRSASALSSASRSFSFNPDKRKMEMSGYLPAHQGPLTHTMSPDWIEIPISYLTAGFLNLWDHQLLLVSPSLGGLHKKSVPSTVIFCLKPASSIKRLDHKIYLLAARTSRWVKIADSNSRMINYLVAYLFIVQTSNLLNNKVSIFAKLVCTNRLTKCSNSLAHCWIHF